VHLYCDCQYQLYNWNVSTGGWVVYKWSFGSMDIPWATSHPALTCHSNLELITTLQQLTVNQPPSYQCLILLCVLFFNLDDFWMIHGTQRPDRSLVGTPICIITQSRWQDTTLDYIITNLDLHSVNLPCQLISWSLSVFCSSILMIYGWFMEPGDLIEVWLRHRYA